MIDATGRGRRQTYGRADAPTGLWKTAWTRFPTPPTAFIGRLKGERTQNDNGLYIEPLSLEANTG
jgi:hypothetical protein